VDGQDKPSSLFGERIEVRLVNLEVVVTDGKGNRVSDLRVDDFLLRVDGKEVPVGFFSEIIEGRRRPAIARDAQETESTGSASPNLTGAAPGEAVGTSYLVFIDRFFVTVVRDLNLVLRGIAEQIPNLGPRDQMALVSFDGRKLEMLSNWTNSQRDLMRALHKAMGQSTSGIRTTAAVDALSSLDVIDSAELPAGEAQFRDGSLTASNLEERAVATAQIIENHLERIVLGVTATMRSFARPPGRRVMLLLSGGWPQSACDYVTGPRSPLQNTSNCGGRGPALLRPMYEVANLLGYTLYPVDVPTSSMEISAADNDIIGLARNGPTRGDGVNVVGSRFRESEIHSTLYKLALETGGIPMINETRLSSLERVIEDTRSYYWLGFTPEWKGNDKSRKIKLEVLRPGLKLRYREGFRDLSRSREVDFMVESALLFGDLPGASTLGLTLGPVPTRGRKVEIPLELRIPMDEITLLPHQGRYVAELELRVGALDDRGERNEIAAVPVTLDGDGPAPPGAHATYNLAIQIRRKPQDLVVSIYDPIGDRLLVATTRFVP
jgi:VWFA-related protein